MKVFISWSGERSKKMGLALHEALPNLLHNIVPLMSEVDIEAGDRWFTAIASQLESSDFGIVCITAENANSIWLNFEAGALSKSLSQSKVIPVLLDHNIGDLSGPLREFQAVQPDLSGFIKIIVSINESGNNVGLEPKALQDFIDKVANDYLLKLVEKFEEIASSEDLPKPKRSQEDILEGLDAGLRRIEGGILSLAKMQNGQLQSLVDYVEGQRSINYDDSTLALATLLARSRPKRSWGGLSELLASQDSETILGSKTGALSPLKDAIHRGIFENDEAEHVSEAEKIENDDEG